jgi:predicted O-methyltransferase YrrM
VLAIFLQMDPAATADKLVSLSRIAALRPREFSERVAAIADLLTDSWHAYRPNYDPVAWPVAFGELERLRLTATRTLSEPPLVELERELGRRFAQIKDRAWNGVYNADPTVARFIYAICRGLRPSVVVETGVAYGMTSAYVLKALEVNGQGKLFSVDLPPLGRKADDLQGALVPAELRGRWVLRRGTSQHQLGAILAQHPVDLFVHDSLHTYQNMRREFEQVWSRLRPGGLLVSDDIQGNSAFLELRGKAISYWRAVQQDGKAALFGVLVKAEIAPPP